MHKTEKKKKRETENDTDTIEIATLGETFKNRGPS